MTTLRPGTPEEAGMSPERIENLRRLGAKWVEDGTHPALVLLVARRGVIVLHEAWGRFGPEPDAPPLTIDAIFPMASITKMLTATCAMILVEDGVLGLNRPVQEYVPEFQGEGKDQVLVHHLLTHTAGLRDDLPGLRTLVESMQSDDSLPAEPGPDLFSRAAFSEVCSAPLSTTPGQEMSYSNLGYEMIGEIIERVSGQSLVDFSRGRVFDPLGMKSTSYLLPESQRSLLVGRPPDASVADLLEVILGRFSAAMGSATSTSLDIAILGQTFLNRGCYDGTRIFSPAVVREMTRNQISGVPTEYMGERVNEASWGYGWAVKGFEKWVHGDSLLSPQTFWHSGGSGTKVWIDPLNQLVVVYFSILLHEGNRFDRRENDDLFANAVVAAIED